MTSRQFSEEEVQDLTDRIFLLSERLSEGKIHIAEHLVEGFRESWGAVQMRPDGLVDPHTVDGRIRAMTLAVRAFQYRDELKSSISLGDIQDAYFTYLDRQFGVFLREMKRRGATPSQAARAIASDESFIRHALAGLPELVAEVREFWQSVAEAGLIHLQDGQQLKANFAGDIFPQHWENIVSRVGLYIDTVVLPCPIVRLGTMLQVHASASLVEMFLKHVLTAMEYRHLATANVSPPLVLVLPAEDEVLGEDRAGLIARATPLSLAHAKYVFDRDFESADSLFEFCSELNTIGKVLSEVKRGDRLLFDSDWPRDSGEQLNRVIEARHPLPPGMDPAHPGYHVFNSCIGRMPQALDAREKALAIGGTPLISAQTSWDYFTWMLEYSSTEAARVHGHDSLHMAHAFGAGGERLEWLGNVPAETVLEIRRQGHAEEIRNMLSDGVSTLTKINPNNYARTAQRVSDNLDRAFRQHQEELRKASAARRKFYGIDVGASVAVGTIAVAAAITASPTLGAISGVLGLAGAPSLKDLKSKYRNLRQIEHERSTTPTGLLFKHLN